MRLNHRVTLQRRTGSADSLGQASTTWEDVATVWADVAPLRGREYFAAGQTQSTADVRIRIRHRADIDAAWRVKWGETLHGIVSQPINVDGRNEYLELMCMTGVGDGR